MDIHRSLPVSIQIHPSRIHSSSPKPGTFHSRSMVLFFPLRPGYIPVFLLSPRSTMRTPAVRGQLPAAHSVGSQTPSQTHISQESLFFRPIFSRYGHNFLPLPFSRRSRLLLQNRESGSPVPFPPVILSRSPELPHP